MAIAESFSPILVVAAEAREFRGILRNCGPVKKLEWPVRFAALANWLGQTFVFAAHGPGPRLASQILKAAEVNSAKAGIRAVISTGFCGGLDPQLQLGDIVNATSVIDGATGRQWNTAAIRTTTSPAAGPVLSVDRVAVTGKEKADLRTASHAVAVEMEAAPIAEWAFQNGTPFHCLRVVSDTAQHDFVMDMNNMRDSEGRFDRLKITWHALANPVSRISGLLQLDRNCRLAEERLGTFFASCRF